MTYVARNMIVAALFLGASFWLSTSPAYAINSCTDDEDVCTSMCGGSGIFEVQSCILSGDGFYYCDYLCDVPQCSGQSYSDICRF